MNFFDPDRPRLANQAPAFNTSRLQGALPSLSINLHSPGKVRLTAFLPVTQTRYRPEHREMEVEALAGFLRDYEQDPEECLALYFQWKVESIQEESRTMPNKEVLGKTDQSADDLGF